MTQDEIIKMAREVGLVVDENRSGFDDLEALIKLATAKEREACAKLAEEYGTWGGSSFYEWFKKLGAEIRARGES